MFIINSGGTSGSFSLKAGEPREKLLINKCDPRPLTCPRDSGEGWLDGCSSFSIHLPPPSLHLLPSMCILHICRPFTAGGPYLGLISGLTCPIRGWVCAQGGFNCFAKVRRAQRTNFHFTASEETPNYSCFDFHCHVQSALTCIQSVCLLAHNDC